MNLVFSWSFFFFLSTRFFLPGMFSCQHTIELRRKGNKDFSAAQMLDLFFVQQKQLLSLPKQDSCVPVLPSGLTTRLLVP